MYNSFLSQKKNTKRCATLKFCTHYSYTNFNIDNDGTDDTTTNVEILFKLSHIVL